MTNFKRIIALIITLSLALSLVACGGNGNGDGNSGQIVNNAISEADAFDTDAFIATMPASLRGTTIKYLNWYNPYDQGEEGKVIDAFEQATGINVEIINPGYTLYEEKLAGLVATGDAPDVFALSQPSVNRLKYAQPIAKATGYDFSDKGWNKVVANAYSVDGVQYAANVSFTPFKRLTTVIYNKQIMEEFGFEDPWELYKKGEWTWDKFNEMCSEWVKQGDSYYGAGLSQYGAYAYTQGLDFLKYDGSRYSLNLYDEDLLAAMRTILEMRDNRILVQATNTVFDASKPKSLFEIANSSALEKICSWHSKIRRYGYFAAAPLPNHDGKTSYQLLNELNAYAVPVGAKNPKAVPYFISWISNLAKYNLDDFYYDEQSKAVMMELLGVENQFLDLADSEFHFDSADPFVWRLFNFATPTQLTTYIQEQEYLCEDRLTIMNETLASLQK